MSEKKSTNPKDAVGTKKVPFGMVSAPVMGELNLAMLEGALKYGRHNYRVAGVRASVYVDAAIRHILAYWEGEDIDPDSGLPHPVKAMACLAVLRDSTIQGNMVDDRPPKSPSGWVADLNAKAAALIEKYPSPPPACLATDAAECPAPFARPPPPEPRAILTCQEDAACVYVDGHAGPCGEGTFTYRSWPIVEVENCPRSAWCVFGQGHDGPCEGFDEAFETLG